MILVSNFLLRSIFGRSGRSWLRFFVVRYFLLSNVPAVLRWHHSMQDNRNGVAVNHYFLAIDYLLVLFCTSVARQYRHNERDKCDSNDSTGCPGFHRFEVPISSQE